MADDFRFTILRESGKKFPIFARVSKNNTDLFAQWHKGAYSHQYIIVHCMDINTKNGKKWSDPNYGEYRYSFYKTWKGFGPEIGSVIIKTKRVPLKDDMYYLNRSQHITYPRKKGDNENQNFGKREWITPVKDNKNNLLKQLIYHEKGYDSANGEYWHWLNLFAREKNKYILWYFGTWRDIFDVSVYLIEKQPQMNDGLMYLIRDNESGKINFYRYTFSK